MHGPTAVAARKDGVQDERGQELPGEQLAVADRVRPKELERPELPLLGEEPHGDEGQDEERDQAIVEEHESPEPARLVRAATSTNSARSL
jgi:hypothetical protein